MNDISQCAKGLLDMLYSVQDSMSVAKCDTFQQLIHQLLSFNEPIVYICVCKTRCYVYLQSQDINISTIRIKKLFKVRVQIFKYQRQFLFCMQHIIKSMSSLRTKLMVFLCVFYLRIFGCFSSFSREISRMAVQGTFIYNFTH